LAAAGEEAFVGVATGATVPAGCGTVRLPPLRGVLAHQRGGLGGIDRRQRIAAGMRSTAPCLSRLTLPRMKAWIGAQGDHRAVAADLVAAGHRAGDLRQGLAALDGDAAIGRCRDRRGGTHAGVPGAAAVAARGAGAAGVPAGGSRAMVLERVPAGATISGSATASALDGASTSAEYSRTRRPWPQSASIRKLSDGVSTGACEVTRTTALPCALRVSSNCSSLTSPVGRCRPTRSKVTGEASATRRFSSSDGRPRPPGFRPAGLARLGQDTDVAQAQGERRTAGQGQQRGGKIEERRFAPLARLFMGDTIKRADRVRTHRW
jgi:hypothetical protein